MYVWLIYTKGYAEATSTVIVEINTLSEIDKMSILGKIFLVIYTEQHQGK